jgi:hypothetical protein
MSLTATDSDRHATYVGRGRHVATKIDQNVVRENYMALVKRTLIDLDMKATARPWT